MKKKIRSKIPREGEVLTSNEFKSQRCDRYGKKFNSRWALMRHAKKVVCSNIPKEEEILTANELQSQQCDKCGKKFKYKYRLRTHVKRNFCSEEEILGTVATLIKINFELPGDNCPPSQVPRLT